MVPDVVSQGVTVMRAYYRPAGPENAAIVVVHESGEDFDSSHGISPWHARSMAECGRDVTPAFRNELIAAAERYVLDTMVVSP
jgi:hypothetical protein